MGEHDIDLRKALTTEGGSGANLIPEVVSEGIRQFVISRSVLWAAIPKRDWPTNSYIHRDVTALPTASFAADGAALPAATKGTYAKPTVPMKYIYTRGEVTGPMQAAAGSLLDALQLEIDLHATALVRTIEQKLLDGDSDVGTGDVDEFDGMIKQIRDAATNVHDAATTPLTLAMLDEALDLPDSYPTHMIMSRAMGRRLWSLLKAQQRFTDDIDVAAGFRVPSYNMVPIVRMDNQITGLDTTIVLPDFNWTVVPINEQITYEPLAKTKDSDDFMLKMYLTLALEGTSLYHAMIDNVTSVIA